jgi:hypothetical protein
VKLFAPATGAAGLFVLGVATAGVPASVEGAGVVCATAVSADAPTSAAARIIFFIEVFLFL